MMTGGDDGEEMTRHQQCRLEFIPKRAMGLFAIADHRRMASGIH